MAVPLRQMPEIAERRKVPRRSPMQGCCVEDGWARKLRSGLCI